MNSRGAVGIALALIAFNQDLLNKDLYSSLILLALITTVIFPFVITSRINKSRKLLN